MSQKQEIMIRSGGEKEEARNPYYLHISSVYRIAKWGMLLVFTLFLVGMLAWGRESITYENLQYLMRDLNMPTAGDALFTHVRYEEEQHTLFDSYSGHLAVAGSLGIRLYDGRGSCVFSDSLSYKNPVLCTGEKYMLLYDAGGTEYAIFTSLACVYRGESEGVLQSAAISDSGAYCTVSRSGESKYVITLYNASFVRQARYFRDSYVSAAAISEDGRALAVLSVSSADWRLQSELTFYSDSSKESVSVSLGDSLPVAASFMAGGNLSVLCDDRVLSFDGAGNLLSEISLASTALTYFDFSDNKTALVCRENVLGSAFRILVLDSAGRMICEGSKQGKITGIRASSGEDGAYVLFGDTVEIYSLRGNRAYSHTQPIRDICEIGGHPVICFASEAMLLAQSGKAE